MKGVWRYVAALGLSVMMAGADRKALVAAEATDEDDLDAFGDDDHGEEDNFPGHFAEKAPGALGAP